MSLSALKRSELGVLVPLFILLARFPDIISGTGASGLLTQTLVAVPLAAAVIYQLAIRRAPPARDPVLLGMLAYGAAIAVSALGAWDRSAVLGALVGYLRDVAGAFVLVTCITTLAGLRLAIWTVMAAGAFSAGAALLGAALGNDLGGLARIETSYLAHGVVGTRLGGAMGESNWFALMLIAPLGLALYLFWDERRPALRYAALLAIVLVSLAIVLTFSRGGALGLLAVVTFAAIARRPRPSRRLAAGALALIAVGVTTPGLYWERLATLTQLASGASPTDGSLHDRLALAQIGSLVFLGHPLTGVGPGNFLAMYPLYVDRVDKTLAAHPLAPHSGPIQIAADTGLAGLATFASTVVLAVYGLVAASRRCYQAGLRSQGMLLEALTVAILGYLVGSLFLDTSYNRYFWPLIGLAVVGRRLTRTEASAS